ncbi:MAG: aminopeptidase P family protein [Clostridia bacterium]|nr:aminopeptidase P family protein [Clostridia bacterium]
MTTNEKLALLRAKMKAAELDAYIVPTADSHLSEYIPERFKFRRWLSGFCGSAGTLVVCADRSGLWTDGRYYIQAEKELKGSEIELHKAAERGVKGYVDYLCDVLDKGARVGLSGALISERERANMAERFASKDIELDINCDFSDIWTNRPDLPENEVFLLDIEYAGESVKSKIERVRKYMTENGVTAIAFTMLDCVMWLFNIRGSDIEYCPFALSRAVVDEDTAKLYIRTSCLNEAVRETLAADGVDVCEYEDFERTLAAADNVIGLDFSRTNAATVAVCKNVKNVRDCIFDFKAQKNDAENAALKECYIADCAALARAFCRVEKMLAANERVTECKVSDIVLSERKKIGTFISASFDTIAAYGANAAMMHYSPAENTCAALESAGMLLVDSGGQYLNGTTDITRTIVLGDISERQRRDFTLVLKGAIRLAEAKFIKGTTGANLDVLARLPLWEKGIDYKCGTGHGVGFCLNVHEGPQAFSQSLNSVPLQCGMNLTIEPGVYIEGEYGIRTENNVCVVPFAETDSGEFFGFEMLSYFPIDLRGIDAELLSQAEKEWLNDYHAKTYAKLSPFLDGEAQEWLKRATRPIN